MFATSFKFGQDPLAQRFFAVRTKNHRPRISAVKPTPIVPDLRHISRIQQIPSFFVGAGFKPAPTAPN